LDIKYRKGHVESEEKVLTRLAVQEPQALLERFSTLVRSSGKADERKAAEYLSERLNHYEIPHQIYEPTLYISLPVKSSLQFEGSRGWADVRCTSPSFSASTTPDWIEARGIKTSATRRQGDLNIFDSSVVDPTADVKGRIAFCEGTFSPGMVRSLEDMGAVGVIMINPGERIHESNCSTVWGTATLDNMHRLPGIPVVSITRSDGDRLLKTVSSGGGVFRIRTHMDTGWRRCPMVVAEISGTDEPESFILVHGHLDSWYYGLCDNATGNAALLELARVFHSVKEGLGRSVRIAWWPGHSHGRYAGSTWYADNFAIDLEENCVAQINIDSPGAKWATSYDNAMFMEETAAFVRKTIQDVSGQIPSGRRPQRAGDYSFNNIGITSAYMSLTEIPEEISLEKGFYLVGGNGGNSISWHTDHDVMAYVDLDILKQDLKVYGATICRIANALLLPFDFRRTVKSHREQLQFYQEQAGDRFDLTAVMEGLDELSGQLEFFYRDARQRLASASDAGVNAMKPYNEELLALARTMIPVDYVNMARFEHDPAVPIPSLGRLLPATDLAHLDSNPHLRNITVNTLVRRRNQILSAYRGISKRLKARKGNGFRP